MKTCKMWWIVACLAGAAQSHAEILPDPTKPPVGYATGETVAAGPVLQSILISPTRRNAVVSGKTVQVGDTVGGGKVISIGENEVVLQSGKSREVLRLYQPLRKTAGESRPDKKIEGSGQ